jgi:hypothetical protein
MFLHDQLEQGRFARTVGANETDLLVVLNFPAQVFENGMSAENEAGI